ncbi:hypothetical protein [Caballeronia sp. LZ001]|uniref:hypothetical protein n=1 Tax=Caballeronia sp. LZ001 TaxID=3038553 RepID=UPI002858DA7D|nr:hypothetical protein [Caballeronia sp. LZ001]MDR5801592.1 hypothetical protein [Caballeronia sp. LZ001]
MINLDALRGINLDDLKRALFNGRTQPMPANDNPLAPDRSGKSPLDEIDKAQKIK